MSDNPFDVFAADFRAAIPSTNEPPKQQQQDSNINIMAEPAAAPVPVMNSAPAPPPMNSAPMAPPPNGMMGGPPPPQGGGMMGAPPPPVQQLQQQQQPGGYGAPPPVYGNGMNGSMGGPPAFGNPPPPPANAYGMGATMGASMTAPPPNAWNSTSGGMSMAGSSMNASGMNGMNAGGMNGAMVPSATPSNPYATMMNNAPPPAAPPVPTGTADPFGMQPAYGAPQPPQPNQQPVYGAPPPAPVPVPDASSVAPSVTPSTDPWGTAAPTPMPPAPAAPPVPAAIPETPSVTEPSVMTSDPWGSTTAPPPPPQQQPPPPAPPVPAAPGAIVPTNATSADPFDIFAGQAPVGGGGVPPPQPVPLDDRSVMTPGAPPAYNQEQVLQAADDPWSQMGFGEAPTPGATGTTSGPPVPSSDAVPAIASGEPNLLGGDDGLSPTPTANDGTKDGQLPPGGEWYDARIYTPTLGVMFFKPQELTDSLFLQTDRSLVDALGDRPVVAFIVEGSSARAAGVELGHVLLKVNDIDVKNPKEASRLIKEGPRPLPLLFYVPDTTVVVAEGEHMVKYDTRETGAPNSAKDWKPKYVVIGGIIAQPWMMNMYRSKSEYDIAVIETQARRPVSVKVKQFSLQGARIQNDWQGPQMVKYKNKLHPWKYIVILPVSRNPIKISSPNLSQLKPVHEGVRRVLMAQQRHQPTSAPVQRADPYGQPPDDNGGAGGGGGPGEYGHHQGPPGGAPPGGSGQYGHHQGPPGGAPPGGMGGQPAYGGNPGGNPGGNMYETQGGVSSARRSSQY